MTFLILIISSLLVGCAGVQMPNGAPKPPAVLRCPIIQVDGADPYLVCQWSTGGSKYRIPLDRNLFKVDKFICTNAQGYKNGENYLRELSRWANNNCKGK